jgi:hypothetical protein
MAHVNPLHEATQTSPPGPRTDPAGRGDLEAPALR